MTYIVIPFIIPYLTPFKELRLQFTYSVYLQPLEATGSTKVPIVITRRFPWLQPLYWTSQTEESDQYELYSKLPKGGLHRGSYRGLITIGAAKGDTRSLDYGSYGDHGIRFWRLR